MLRHLLGALLRAEILQLKRQGYGLGVQILGGLVAGLAALFLLASLYLYLSLHMAPWQAALVVAGLLLAVAAGVIAIGGRIRRPARRATLPAAHESRNTPDPLPRPAVSVPPPPPPSMAELRVPLPAALAALVTGVAVGRFLSR